MDILPELRRAAKNGRQIALALDSDPAGQQARRELACRLVSGGVPATRISLVTWPAKDANEYLKQGGQAQAVLDLIRAAPVWLEAMVTAASPNGDRGRLEEQAMGELLAALASLNKFELPYWRERICERLKLRKSDFDGWMRLAQAGSRKVETCASQYQVQDGWISQRTHDSAGKLVLKPLCNFNAWIEQDVLRDNGQEVERVLRIRGELNQQRLPLADVRASEFSRMDWIIREWGSAAIIEPGNQRREHLRAAIQHLSQGVVQRRIYTHTGWHVDGERRVYLTAGGAVGVASHEKADGSGNGRGDEIMFLNNSDQLEVELDRELAAYDLPADPQNVAQAMSSSISYLTVASGRVTYPLWAAMWLAPLRELVSCAFTLWLYGATGTFKSTLAALALNHYGANFDEKHLPASFTDTANRLEQKAFTIKDAPLVIDDFAPQKEHSSHQEYTRTAHRMVRGAGNLTGRGRLSAKSTPLTTYVPRSLLMITGEDLPNSQSLVARLFVVEVERGDVDRQRLSQLQSEAGRLSHAMAGYLRWLAGNWTGLAETIPARWRQYREQAIQNGLHLRLPEAIASLSIGLEMGLRFGAYLGVIDGESYQLLLNEGCLAFGAGSQAMISHLQEEKPEELFLRTLRELLTQGKVCLRHREDGTTLPEADERAELLGWYDEDYVYLLPQMSYNRVAKHFRDQGDPFPVRAQTLRKMLKEAGVLVCKDKRLTQVEWLQGKSQRVLVFMREQTGI